MKHLLIHDWGLCQGSYEKSGSHLSNPLTTLSTLPLVQANVCVLLTSRIQASHSPLVTAGHPPSSQGTHLPCRTPLPGCPICDSHCLFLRADLCQRVLPFGLSPIPGMQILTQFLLFPSYPVICGSFLQAWLFTSFSATFQLVLLLCPLDS